MSTNIALLNVYSPIERLVAGDAGTNRPISVDCRKHKYFTYPRHSKESYYRKYQAQFKAPGCNVNE